MAASSLSVTAFSDTIALDYTQFAAPVGYNAGMPELVYARVYLADGRVDAWSSSRGLLENVRGPLERLFETLTAVDKPAKLMIHLIGVDELVTDDERMRALERAKRAGFTTTRFETGAPLEPDEAFQLLTLPFT